MLDEARQSVAVAAAARFGEERLEVLVFLASDPSRSRTGATVDCDRDSTAFKMPERLARALAGGAS